MIPVDLSAYSIRTLRKFLLAASAEEAEVFLPLIEAELDRRKYDWTLKARREQLPPTDDDWLVWLILAGRGWGKTRTGAEWIKAQATTQAGTRWAVVAATSADARDTCIEGDSGLLRILPQHAVKTWNRSLGELLLENGSLIKTFTADEPDRLRGPQFHGAWADELAAWRYPDAWDQLQFGLRLGNKPRTVVTTTPRPTKLVKELLDRDTVRITRGSTFDNAKNLAPSALEELKRRYEGTRLGRQELYAEVLLESESAIASYDQLDGGRRDKHPELLRTVVSIDPAVTNTSSSDDTGISVQGKGIDGDVYLLADLSCKVDVDDWAKRAIRAALEYKAGMVLYEKNQGADAIGSILKTAMRSLGVDPMSHEIVLKDVTAHKSKFDRAMSLQQWIQQGRWHLTGRFPELEDQLTSWDMNSGYSPDRIDAAVHGFNELTQSEQWSVEYV